MARRTGPAGSEPSSGPPSPTLPAAPSPALLLMERAAAATPAAPSDEPDRGRPTPAAGPPTSQRTGTADVTSAASPPMLTGERSSIARCSCCDPSVGADGASAISRTAIAGSSRDASRPSAATSAGRSDTDVLPVVVASTSAMRCTADRAPDDPNGADAAPSSAPDSMWVAEGPDTSGSGASSSSSSADARHGANGSSSRCAATAVAGSDSIGRPSPGRRPNVGTDLTAADPAPSPPAEGPSASAKRATTAAAAASDGAAVASTGSTSFAASCSARGSDGSSAK